MNDHSYDSTLRPFYYSEKWCSLLKDKLISLKYLNKPPYRKDRARSEISDLLSSIDHKENTDFNRQPKYVDAGNQTNSLPHITTFTKGIHFQYSSILNISEKEPSKMNKKPLQLFNRVVMTKGNLIKAKKNNSAKVVFSYPLKLKVKNINFPPSSSSLIENGSCLSKIELSPKSFQILERCHNSKKIVYKKNRLLSNIIKQFGINH